MLTLIGCLLLLLVPLSMLSSLITERSAWRDSVADKLSQSTSGPQRLFGPLIAVPWSEIATETRDGKDVTVQVNHLRYYLPDSLKVTGDQQVEQRKVGIYQGQVWRTGITVNATFNKEQLDDMAKPGIILGAPQLVMGVGDSRGISSVTPLNVGDKQFDFQPGSGLPGNSEGLHVALPAEMLQQKTLALNFAIKLQGTRQLEVVPLGKNTTFDLKSNWPHPGFTGSFLPEKHQITPEGFTARWQSSWFANNLNSLVRNDFTVSTEKLPAFSAMVVNPVDQYQQTERAVKYAILLIGLTYMAFFLFETLTALRVHPMQYLLVGLSLVMFFLVLLALSEHIGFNLAWLTASLTCAAINGFYLQAVLQGWRRSLLFVGGVLVLDAVLWQLLQSEDSALLLGTGVLMAALAAVMALTRNIDWYRLSATVTSDAATEEGQNGEGRFGLWK
jgi:inner membrane protein